MIEIEKEVLNLLRFKEVYYSKTPYDIQGFHVVWFNCCTDRVNKQGFTRESTATLTIDLEQSLDQIWQNMDKSSCRYSIRRAQREGIKIKINQNYEEFCLVDRMFRKR